jgi:hypothetical protein
MTSAPCLGKVQYRTHGDAALPLLEARKRARKGGRVKPMAACKPYLCESCGMWHLGRAWKRGVDERRAETYVSSMSASDKPTPIPNVYDLQSVLAWLRKTNRADIAERLRRYMIDGNTSNGTLRGLPYDDRADWAEDYKPQDVQLFKALENDFPSDVQFYVWW